MKCINITVKINGQTTQNYPIPSGTKASDLIKDSDFTDLFQVPENVEPVVNGVSGDNILSEGDTLEVKTKASSKAA